MAEVTYNRKVRIDYIKTNLIQRYKYDQETYLLVPRVSWSYGNIADDIFNFFGRPKNHAGVRQPLNRSTVMRDITQAREMLLEERKIAAGLNETDELLAHTRFAEWRSTFFRDPTTGGPFVTPRHQMAWFYVIAAVTLKKEVAIPDWVVKYLDLPERINEVIGDVADGRSKNLLSFILLGPPRHGKTELALHVMIWLICRNHNVRILYGNGPLKTTKQQIENIKWHLENNEALVAAYGPFRDDNVTWTKEEFEVGGRDIAAKARTVKGFGTGMNINSLDADVIFADDIQGPEAAMSEAQTDSDYHWVTSGLMTRREPHTAFVGLGSHQPSPTGDLWTRIEDKHEELTVGNHVLIIRKVKAHDYSMCDPEFDPAHEKCVLWHELRPYPYLEALRGLMGDDDLFEAVYNQRARSKAMIDFPPQVINGVYSSPQKGEDGRTPVFSGEEPGCLDKGRVWKKVPSPCCSRKLVTVMGYDPAGGAKKSNTRSSFNAAVVLAGCPVCERRYLIDYMEKRQSPERNPDTIKAFFMAYPEITRLKVEVNGYQKSLARDPRLKAHALKYHVRIREWDTDDRKWDPDLGVPTIGQHIRMGMFSIPASSRVDVKYGERLRRSLIRWPGKPNDIPMALWLAEIELQHAIKQYNNIETGSEIMEGHHPSDAAIADTWEVDLSLVGEYADAM